MDLLICNFLNTNLMVWSILDVVYVYIKTKKLIFSIMSTNLACECFPKHFGEFLNFKVCIDSCKYCLFTNSNFVVLIE